MDYKRLTNSVDRLLKKFGFSVKVTRDAGTTSVGTAYAVFVESEASNIESTLLAQTSTVTKTLLLSGLSKEPLVNDWLEADKETYVVKSVEKVRPSTTTVLYELKVAG